MLAGKGIYIWMIRYTLDGDVEAIADTLQAAGCSHAWIKIADGSGRYNIDPLGKDRVPNLITALRARDIACWGWQYVYGRYPEAEAYAAIARIKELGLDGFVVNAEVEYKSAGAAAARTYMGLLRKAFPELEIGLSSYRFPSYHPEFPFDAFLEFCDFNAPQVYWVGAHNPGDQLRRCLTEFRTLVTTQCPIFPTGSAYSENGWRPTAAEVEEFMGTAVQLGLWGFNFWELRNCLINLPDVWEVIKAFPRGNAENTEEEEEPVQTGLKARVVSQMLNVRSGPGIHFPVIGSLQSGEVVEVLDIGGSDSWMKIHTNPDQWIAMRYLTKTYSEIIS